MHSMNALALLRRERPDAHIAWAVEERFAGLLEGHPHVDELIIVPRRRWSRLLRNPLRWGELAAEVRRLIVRLRAGRFEASLDFQSSLKSAWLVLAARAPRRIGFGPPVSRELSHLVQNSPVTSPGEGVHRVERDLALTAPLGIRTRYAAAALPCSARHADAVDAALGERRTGGPLVVIHPGTSAFAAFKRWAPERYAMVADALVEQRRAEVVVSWGPADRDLARQVVRHMRQPGRPAPRTSSLQQLVRLLQRADLFIGSDTGPMHLASALGTPVVALFGPKDPVQTGPYCSRSLVVTGHASCRPCPRRRCSDPRCMSSISAARVLDAALAVLDGQGECRARPGPVKGPFSWPFRLGPRRGEVTTAWSDPGFFTWLCELDRRLASSSALSLPAREGQVRVSLPVEPAVGAERLLVDRLPGGARRARRAWWAAARTPVALRPVCWMREAGRHGRGAVVILEHRASLRPLAEVAGDAPGGGRAGRVADAVGRMHRSGLYHGDLRAHNVLVDGDEVRIVPTGRSRRMGRLPAEVRCLLRGLDMGTLAADLDGAFGPDGEERLFDLYCKDFTDGGRGRRLLARAFRRRKERRSWLRRFW